MIIIEINEPYGLINTFHTLTLKQTNNIFELQADLAQLVEHFIRNERVVGSNPIVGSKY
jgi:hypothetical protein